MTFIANNMKWIMIVSGALTSTMFYAMLAPQAALASMFGDVLNGPLAEIVVRNWGALVGMVGVLLIYGAFRPHNRPIILVFAGVSKTVFIMLVLVYGRVLPGTMMYLVIAIDFVMTVVSALYLMQLRARSKQLGA